MNQQQLQASGPPIASSSRLPPIKTLQHSHSFDDQAAAAAAAAALLQIKRSPSSAHSPLLPSFHDIHSSYSSAYPTPGSNGDLPSNSSSSTLFPYLPPIRTDCHQHNLPRPSSANASPSTAPAYFPSAQSHPPPTTSFRPYQYSPNPPSHPPAPPHSPSSPPRKRKRTFLPGITYQEPGFSDPSGLRKYSDHELAIDVEGDGELEAGVTGIGDDEGEGEVRCICGYNVDDGFTIQCERCHIWQHAACFSIPTIDAVPEVYLCERCDPCAGSHRQLDYEGARRMQQQRLAMGGTGTGEGGDQNGRTMVGTGEEPSTTGRGGTRKKRTGSPKVERKGRGGAGGVTRRRASSAAQHPHPYADSAGGGGRKVNVSGGRKKEKEPSPATAPHQNNQQRQHPLHSTHPHNTDDSVLPTQQQYQPAIPSQPLAHVHSSAPPRDSSHSSEEPWTEQYVQITQDIVHPSVHPVLRSYAHTWRGVTAFSAAETGANDELSPITSCVPMPTPNSPTDTTPSDTRNTFLHPLSSALSPPSRPPTYTLHALRPIARQSYVVPYTCAITPSREYLREPTSQYAQLGVPKQGVHLVPPPLELCLDARGVGGEGRWVRSGCHPNAVLRPVVCDKAKRAKEKGINVSGTSRGGAGEQTVRGLSGTGVYDTTAEKGEGEMSGSGAEGGSASRVGGNGSNESEEDEGLDVTFGVFAIRDLKAEEEIVLGWEWDDRHVVHELPRLLKEGYGSGTPALKRAMGEVLSTLFSTFTTCACGASAHNCAITQMQKFADLESSELEHNPDPELIPHEQQQHRTSNLRDQRPQLPPDLGPLIGATRGLRTTDRGQGGREGVELVSASGHVPSVESVARAFRGVASDSGSDANSHATSPSQKRVHFPGPTPAPEVVVSPATSATTLAAPSPRKSWERRYSESRSIETSEDEDEGQHEDDRTRRPKPPRKKARTTLRIDSSPSVMGDTDGDARTLEETLPPKMRKNWIKETLRVLNTEGQEIEDNHIGVQSEEMDIDGKGAGVKYSPSLVEADSMTVSLQSPSTALAGLSLRGSPIEPLIPGSSNNHVSEASVHPEAVDISLTDVLSLPNNLASGQTDNSSSPNAPSRSHSPSHSPIRSRTLELLPVSTAAANASNQHTSPVNPSSAINANPISPATNHILGDGSLSNEAPLSTPVPHDVALPHNDDSMQGLPPPSSLPTPKKPPIKRRTLADWKSRKEKERIAQALLQPPPRTSPKPQESGPSSVHPLDTHSAVSVSAEVSTRFLFPNDAHMGDVDITGSHSKHPSHEQNKEDCDTQVSPQTQNLAVFREEALDLQSANRNGHGLAASAEGDVTASASASVSFPSPTLPSNSSGAVFFGSSADLRVTPNNSFSPELSFSNDVQSIRKSSRPLPEDGEINISPYTAPPHPPSRPSSHPPSRPSSHPPSRPRSPPTQPRSFHASSPTPSLPRSSPPSFARGGPLPALSSDSNPNSRPRPLPSGPRALRNGYPPPASSGSSQYHGGRGYSRPSPSSGRGFYSPGRPFDRDSDRGWTPRGRGRGGSVSGRSFGGGGDRR